MATEPDSTLHTHLKQIAEQVGASLPDLHQMAHEAARKLLAGQGIADDPDTFYWHRFQDAQSSNRSYTGWMHSGVPVESMTFTELLIRRFRVGDQDAADNLSLIGGFYRAAADAGQFDERNEIRLLPQVVLPLLWQLDFASTYQAALGHFWRAHAESVRTLSRISCLAAGVAANRAGQLSRQQLQGLFDGLGVVQPMALSLADLQGAHAAQHGVTVSAVCIGGHELVSALLFTDAQALCLLYLGGREQPVEVFAEMSALHAWLQRQLGSAATCRALVNHCAVVEPQAAIERERAFLHLGGLPSASFASRVELRSVGADAAAWLRDQVRLQLHAQAELLLRSNADLRKQLWIGYLSAGLRIFAPMAPMAWPLALLAVLGGIANLGLNIDRAVTAPSTVERRAALLGAMLGGIELLLNLALLIPAALPLFVRLEPYAASPVIAPEAPALANTQGVFALESGQYIRLDGVIYRVRYEVALKSWLIVDPERPFAFYGNYPVRLNAELEWEHVAAPCLRGGGACLSTPRTSPMVDETFATTLEIYEVPPQAREATRELLGAAYRRMLSGDFYDPDSALNPVWDSLQRLRAGLVEEAELFFEELPGIPQRSNLYAPDPQMPAERSLLQLLEESRGVVIGETHQSIASKRFLIENMRTLARNGVDTLYLEHVMSDLHQLDLDLFSRTGKLTNSLESYLRELDEGHMTDPSGQFTFTHLVKAAGQSRIRVRALDCAASYRLDGLDVIGAPVRQRVFSYYASRVIGARQSRPGLRRWVALVGNTHVCTYKGVPGLAQLSDVTGIRIVDAGAGQATQMTLDPGEYFQPSMSRPDGVVRADWRLALQTRKRPYAYLDPSLAPAGVRRP
ncbi:hypothetical protein DCO48_21075 [Pseudomonas sp. SDI]|uniref:membrane-targeted effector domain-containing toxin n=1 Tax=Pseudomonas sp. SDI TaxID=2170734 RepID=UPI000DE5F802|nr:membrane-targeted effector domain-containing toxin [Pseudomonas sp. SDI]PWB30252.1 hypothetical protein DCO48_21075 [Pseudomonas sp. SDI]